MKPASPALLEAGLTALRAAVEYLQPDITVAEWEYFRRGLTLLMLPRGAVFLAAGQVHHHLGFVVRGLVREYYLDELGQEVTIAFFPEGEYATDYAALLAQRASRYTLRCLEPTTLLTLSYQHMQTGYQQHAGLERYGRVVAEQVVQGLKARIESFQFRSAEQRYLDFLEQRPDLFRRVSLTHLASYLGVERPSLSRIRKKLGNR